MSKDRHLIIPCQPENEYDASQAKLRNELGECLRTARTEKNMQQRQVVEELASHGISISAGALSKWEKGDAMPNPYQLFALCYIYGIDDVLRFFTGNGGRLLNEIGRKKVREYEADLLATGLYEWIGTEQVKQHVNPFIQHKAGSSAASPETEGKMIRMPVSLLRTSAGLGSFLDEDRFEEIDVPVSSVPHGARFGVYVSGDSMLPRYQDGQLVWIQPCEEIRPHEIGIFICDGEGFIKMYDEILPDDASADLYMDSSGVVRPLPVLVSLNEKYPPRTIDADCEFRVVGRVLN